MKNKQFWFDCADGRKYLTLKRASRQWINYDCPDVWADGVLVISLDVSMGEHRWYLDNGIVIDRESIRKFVVASDIAFTKWMADKYTEYAEREKNKDYNIAESINAYCKIADEIPY